MCVWRAGNITEKLIILWVITSRKWIFHEANEAETLENFIMQDPSKVRETLIICEFSFVLMILKQFLFQLYWSLTGK